MRVVSLVPSGTETLCAIGGRDMLVGRSHECDYPAGLGDVPVLSGPIFAAVTDPSAIDAAVREAMGEHRPLYTLDADRLRSLRPDMILTQDLCRVCSVDLESVHQVAASMSPHPRVVSLDPHTVEDVLDDALRIGEAAGLHREAGALVAALRERMFRAMDHVTPFIDGPCVAVLEWTDPIYVAGHWTPQLVERAGGRHPLNPTVAGTDAGAAMGPQQAERRAGKSVRVPPEVLVAAQPEYLVICPCGRTLDQARADASILTREAWWSDLPAVRSGHVALVDGTQMFARPGPRLIDALEWLVAWLNGRPAFAPVCFPWKPFPDSRVRQGRDRRRD